MAHPNEEEIKVYKSDKEILVDILTKASFDVISLDEEELADEILKAGFRFIPQMNPVEEYFDIRKIYSEGSK